VTVPSLGVKSVLGLSQTLPVVTLRQIRAPEPDALAKPRLVMRIAAVGLLVRKYVVLDCPLTVEPLTVPAQARSGSGGDG
jgi:hypothetical protein